MGVASQDLAEGVAPWLADRAIALYSLRVFRQVTGGENEGG